MISAVLAAYIPNELLRIIQLCCVVLQDVTVDDIRVRRPLPKLLRYVSLPEIRYLSCYFSCLSLLVGNYYWSETMADWSVYNVRYCTKQLIYSNFIDTYIDLSLLGNYYWSETEAYWSVYNVRYRYFTKQLTYSNFIDRYIYWLWLID